MRPLAILIFSLRFLNNNFKGDFPSFIHNEFVGQCLLSTKDVEKNIIKEDGLFRNAEDQSMLVIKR